MKKHAGKSSPAPTQREILSGRAVRRAEEGECEVVTVVIDRPLGSRHPRFPDTAYPINYGYLPGTLAGDGQPIDAYVFGPTEPLKTAQGQVIAIIHRDDDVEQKLVVATDDQLYSADDIAARVHCMERFFQSRVELLSGFKACGE